MHAEEQEADGSARKVVASSEGRYERERLELLRRAGVLDSLPERAFEQITMLAQDIFSVPVALVSLVDENRQYFKSNRGLGDVRETPRSQAFCDFLVKANLPDLFVVEDATKREPFKSNPLVTGWPYIRFYAGAPVRVKCPSTGRYYVLGTLCIIDCDSQYFAGDVEYSPRESLNEMDSRMLLTLGDLITNLMQQRINSFEKMAKQRLMYVSCTAHDIRSPLMSFQLALDLLKQSKLTEEQEEIVNSAIAATEVMHVSVDKAIEVTRSATGGKAMLPRFAQISVFDVSKRCQQLASSYFRKEVPVKFEVDSMVPPLIYTDSILIWRIATNFLTNAMRHTHHGHIKCRFLMAQADQIPSNDVVERCRNGAFPNMPVWEDGSDPIIGWFRIECSDTGEGVPDSERENIFNIFYQGGKPLEGAGLGLFAVLQCSALLGGACGIDDNPRDEATNQPSPGVCFWASFPIRRPPKHLHLGDASTDGNTRQKSSVDCKELLAKANMILRRGSRDLDGILVAPSGPEKRPRFSQTDSAAPPPPITQETKDEASRSSEEDRAGSIQTCHVLVIEDSATIRKLLCKSLKRVGCETHEAEDGEQGLKALQKSRYDLVFVDFMMPIMDGINCVKQFRTWEQTNRRDEIRQLIIGISANGNDEDVNRGLQAGMDYFEPKPISPEKLRKLLCPTTNLADLYSRRKKQRIAKE